MEPQKLIFISHATPEDNDFALWLSMRLAAAGFCVWSDVTKLVGGEKFWAEIENAIRSHTAKFLLCVTRSANKPGVLRELNVALDAERAEGRDMVVPLKVDGTAFSQFPASLGSYVNAIRFDEGWAGGLTRLLEMLRRDGITPTNTDGFSIVRDWWNTRFQLNEGVEEGQELCASNVFPLESAPSDCWYHPAKRKVPWGFKGEKLEIIAEPFGNGFVSFCGPDEMDEAARKFSIDRSKSAKTPWADFINRGLPEIALSKRDAHRLLQSMLRRTFDRHCGRLGNRRYNLSAKKVCHWIEIDRLSNNEAPFEGLDGKMRRRALVGYKSLHANKEGIKAKRYWHFAIQGWPQLEPEIALILKPHLVFTSDGRTLYDSDTYQHRSRRNQGKNWWNDDWRDRVLAMMSSLAGGARQLRMRVSQASEFIFSAAPVRFRSPVKFVVIEKQPVEQLDEGEGDSGPGVEGEDAD